MRKNTALFLIVIALFIISLLQSVRVDTLSKRLDYQESLLLIEDKKVDLNYRIQKIADSLNQQYQRDQDTINDTFSSYVEKLADKDFILYENELILRREILNLYGEDTPINRNKKIKN